MLNFLTCTQAQASQAHSHGEGQSLLTGSEIHDHAHHFEQATSAVSSGLADYFSSAGFMPHGHCYLWKPGLVWAHVISDSLIGIAYLSISIILYALVRRIRIQFSLVVICFGVFIGACGLTHFLEVWNLWRADYWSAAAIKIITATASVGTGIYLWRLRHSLVTVAEATKLSEQRRLDLEALTVDLEARIKQRTEEVRASHKTLEDVLNGLPSMVMQISRDYTYMMVNSTYEKWFGLKSEEVIGKRVEEILGTDQFAIVEPYIKRALSGEQVQFQAELIYPKIGKRHLQINYVPRFINGEVQSVICNLSDQTVEREAQVQIEQYAIKSERDKAQLEAVFNAVLDGFVVCDMTGEVLLLNEAEAHIKGYRSIQEMKTHINDFVELYELKTPTGEVVPISEWPLNRILRGETITNLELHGKRLDSGQESYFSFSGQPVFDENGRQFLGVIVTRDITQQKKSERAQIESLEQFKTLANAMPQIAFMADSIGEVFWKNEGWYKYTGLSVEESQNHKWFLAIHDNFQCHVLDQWSELIAKGVAFELEFPIRSEGGKYRWFLTKIRPIRDSSQRIARWFGTCTDIEEQKRAHDLLVHAKEQAVAANEAKSRFLANMSHELRTPMTAVLGFTEVLRDKNLTERDRIDALDRIEKSGRSLLRLIDDVLDISKIEAGKVKIQKTLFSPQELLNEVVAIFKLEADRKGIELRLKVHSSVPKRACSDPSRLRQILTNLIGNAVKFTNVGKVEVTLSKEGIENLDKKYLIFAVKDTGIGIEKKDQAKLFQAFAQADESITRKFGGTGLGLVLSKRLAEQLGGELYLATSESGSGSTFVTKIEAGPFHYDQAHISPTLHFNEIPGFLLDVDTLEKSHVLLVEDVVDNQVLMRRYLESARIKVDIAENGEQALAKAHDTSYDLILMDIQLPEMDGIQATQILRQEGFRKPIVALTAHALPEEIHKTQLAGCNEHLTKPVSKAKLLETVQRWLKVGTG